MPQRALRLEVLPPEMALGHVPAGPIKVMNATHSAHRPRVLIGASRREARLPLVL